MPKLLSFFIVCTTAMLLILSSGDSYAKRFGGGKSFGSTSGYNKSYQKQAPSNTASPTNAGTAAAAGSRGGMFGGMLGGLLMGGLLGALFFGGAFDGLNFMDILIFAGIAFVLYKLFSSSRKAQRQPEAATATGTPHQPPQQENQQTFSTDRMFGGGSASINLPKGMDATQLQQRAEQSYRAMQQAWDEADLGTLRQFCTDKVFAEVQDMLREQDGHQTEIISLQSTILECKEIGRNYEVAVMFNTNVNENGTESSVEEVWHFLLDVKGLDDRMLIDGIQQVEA